MGDRRYSTHGALRYLYYEVGHGICHWCNRQTKMPSVLPWVPKNDFDATVDHVVPLSKGGGNGRDNLVLSCRHCNSLKGDMMPDEWEAFCANCCSGDG